MTSYEFSSLFECIANFGAVTTYSAGILEVDLFYNNSPFVCSLSDQLTLSCVEMTSAVVNEKYRCEQCMELQRSLVKTLGEKRALLLRLQKEQARIRKLLREAEKGRKRDGEV